MSYDLFKQVKDLVGEGSLYALTRELIRRGFDREPPPPPPPLTEQQKDFISSVFGDDKEFPDRLGFENAIEYEIEWRERNNKRWPVGIVRKMFEDHHNGEMVTILDGNFAHQGWEWWSQKCQS